MQSLYTSTITQLYAKLVYYCIQVNVLFFYRQHFFTEQQRTMNMSCITWCILYCISEIRTGQKAAFRDYLLMPLYLVAEKWSNGVRWMLYTTGDCMSTPWQRVKRTIPQCAKCEYSNANWSGWYHPDHHTKSAYNMAHWKRNIVMTSICINC